MTQTAQIPEGFRMNAQGNLIAEANIKPIHLQEDELVRELYSEIFAQHQRLKHLKKKLRESFDAHVAMAVEEYGVTLGGKKGNLGLSSFDGSIRIERSINDYITFGPELEAAKALIDECLRDWSKDSGTELRAIVEDAFRVNKKGLISTSEVLKLRRHNFTDPRWLRAMDAIGDSIKVDSSRTYFRTYIRDENGDYEYISLDIASL